MRHFFFKKIWVFMACIFTLQAQAQSLTDILSKAKETVNSLTGKTSNSIVGTWTYTEPAIQLKSSDLLATAGGKVASAKIEKKLADVLKKQGITTGSIVMTFNEDKSYTCLYKNKSSKGTYTYDKGVLTLYSALKKKRGTPHVRISGSSMDMTFSADKLLSFISSLGAVTSASSTLVTISTLAKSYDGLEVGLKFKKK